MSTLRTWAKLAYGAVSCGMRNTFTLVSVGVYQLTKMDFIWQARWSCRLRRAAWSGVYMSTSRCGTHPLFEADLPWIVACPLLMVLHMVARAYTAP